jgi:PhnB protein
MAQHPRWKPPSYSSVSPYLVVSGAQRVIDFVQAVFGATELRRYERSDGAIMHAEVRIDDSVVMLGDAGDGFQPIPSMVHVYVSDVDQVFEKAIAAGASVVEAPRTHEGESDKRGMVTDPCGNTWVLSTQMPG